MKKTKVYGRWQGTSSFEALAGGMGVVLGVGAIVLLLIGWLMGETGIIVVGALALIMAGGAAIVHFQASKEGRSVMRRFWRSGVSHVVLDVVGAKDVVVMAGPQLVLAVVENPAKRVGLVGNTYNMLVDGKPSGSVEQHRAVKLAKSLTKLAGEAPVAVAVYPGLEGEALSIPLSRGGTLLICSAMDLAGVPGVAPEVLSDEAARELVNMLRTVGLPKVESARKRGKNTPKRKKRPKRGK